MAVEDDKGFYHLWQSVIQPGGKGDPNDPAHANHQSVALGLPGNHEGEDEEVYGDGVGEGRYGRLWPAQRARQWLIGPMSSSR